jgi:CheY-like chemotaxis protein
LKLLVCCESEIVLQVAALALERAGHQVLAADREPRALAAAAPDAAALLVDAARARQATAVVRAAGFGGRVLLLGEGDPAELGRLAAELELEGAVASPAADDFPQRLAAAMGQRRRVLIVDDSEIVARLLEEELRAKGFEIQYAPDAERATSIIARRQTRPDLILLDINMPKVDGAQFCRFVKRNEMFRSIKVLFCSGADKERMKQLTAECGADGFLSKDELLGKWIVENA